MLSSFSQLNTYSDDDTFTLVLFHLVLTRKLAHGIALGNREEKRGAQATSQAPHRH
jgi:hypothetical protein